MNLKLPIAIFLFFSSFLGIAQDTGSLNGIVLNKKGEKISGANINIQGTDIGTESKDDGSFRINQVPVGNYLLRLSYVGYQSQEIAISVKAGQTTTLPNIILKSGEEQLSEVIVRGNGNRNSFTRVKSQYVSKLPLKDLENPQVYNNITSELLQDQVVTNFEDALKNAPGISKLWESTGRGNDGAGYYSLRGFPVQPSMVNGLPAVTNGSPDPANIENIEVIKGPSGTLYGSSLISYGGLINITTKTPYDYFGGNVSYTLGSFGLNRVTADVNTPLDSSGDVALRVNTAYHTENSFQDAGFKKSLFVAPSLSYKVNDRLSFLFNTEFYDAESTNPTMLFVDRGAALVATNIDELNYDNNRSYTSNDLTIKTPSYSLQGQMNYELSDEWTSQTAVSRGSSKSKGYYSYLYETTRFYEDLDEGIVLTRYMNNQNSTTLTTDFQQNFIGDFKIGGMRNRVVAGLDYYQTKLINNSTGYIANGNIYLGNASLQNVNEAVYGITDADNYITNGDSGQLYEAAVDDLLAGAGMNPSNAQQDTYSAYVSNVLNITPAFSAMASLRLDQFESETNSQTALSPKFGLVYQPILDKLSVFANYMDGFSNLDPQPTLSGGTAVFEPEHAKQFEIGTKISLANDRITGTLSYYDIRVSNIVFSPEPQVYVQGGEQYSRGVEASFVASPVDGLNIIAGYSYNDSEVTNSEATNDFLNRRPESAGPENQANLWASYRFNSGITEGFGLGFGGNYAGENKIFNRNLGGAFTLPSFTVLNASIFYQVDKFSINLKLNNLTNQDYYNGWSTINPQAPRNFATQLTYNF